MQEPTNQSKTLPEVACRKLFDEVWNQENHGCLLDLLGPQCVLDEALRGRDQRGPFAMIQLVNLYKAFVPDLVFTLEKLTRRGQDVVASWSAEGAHYGIVGSIVPTGRRIRLSGRLGITVSRFGAIEAMRGGWATSSFSRQVGICGEEFVALLRPRDDVVQLRAVKQCEGNAMLLFPVMSVPGWMTWKNFTMKRRMQQPVVTFQLLANRKALEGEPVPRAYCVRAETRALKSALDICGIGGSLDVVGHSAGAAFALDFALEYQEHVRSLTLVEPLLVWVLTTAGPLEQEVEAFVRGRHASYAEEVTEEGYARFLRTLLDYEPTLSSRWPMLRAYMRNMKFRPALLTHVDDPERLRRFERPVMLIQGKDSDRFHHKVIGTLSATLPNVRVCEMSGGHVPHHGENASQFLSVVDHFVKSVCSTPNVVDRGEG